MSLSPGHDTFTVDRLRQVWREGGRVSGKRIGFKPDAGFDRANYKLERDRYFCLRLHASMQDPADHLSRIDKAFDEALDPIATPRGRLSASEDAVRFFI